ncbi:MAG: outer membrane protein transport protein [Mariprofundus sp.]|nr:outer membrane protein transport protein [Mariprofundus sp.]
MKRLNRGLMASGLLLMGSFSAHAGGFEQANQSAAAVGLSNAFAATANDASALVYNPSGIAWVSGMNITAGLDVEYRDSSVLLPGVAPNNGIEPNVGYIFATWSPLDSHWSGGVGFAPLYYINNDWGLAFPSTAVNPSGLTKVTVDHTTFDVVYAINSDLAIGAGADWYITRANLTQGAKSFRDNDFGGFGGHVSLMWKPAYAWSIGAMLRSGARIDIAGKTADTMSFKLPDQVTFGVAHDFADVWRLETDVKWTRWSALKDMHVKTAGVITQSNALNLRDTFTAMAGLTWTWRPGAQARLGYAYDPGANKSAGFSPVIADQDGHKVSIGAGADIYNMHVDLAYQYTFLKNITATGSYAGVYRDRRQSLLLSISKTL